MSAPDPVAVAVESARAMDGDRSEGAALAALVGAAAALTGSRAVALLPLEGGWRSAAHSAGAGTARSGDHGAGPSGGLAVGLSPACDTVRRDGAAAACQDRSDGVVSALGPVHLMPLPSLEGVIGVLALTQPPGATERGLLELLCRHAGLHAARHDDARLRDDLLEERAAALGTLARLADTDTLTGAANRAGLFRVLGSLVGRSEPAGVVLLDLDAFKAVNDTHGHAAGDELLQEVACRLVALVRPTDVVGRLGGDEFVLVVRDADAEALTSLVTRVEQALALPYRLSTGRVQLTASCGFALAVGPTSTGDVLRAADAAMYERKRAHRAAGRPDSAAVIDLDRARR
ncbi:MAG TPA: GGDEF domain-containing protein [Mycobacteriales bacterium]|nr:GGDEF domain-containing protein [Mycobacteriales bacterium]